MKHWYHSKTVWFNVFCAMVFVSNEAAAFVHVLPDAWEAVLSDILKWLLVTGNIGLRFITSSGVKW